MKEDRFEALVWEEIDGVIERHDAEALADHLNRDPTAVERREAILDMAAVLDEVGELEVPSELRPRIVEAVAAAPTPLAHRRAAVQRRSLARRLVSFAAGLVVGALGFWVGGEAIDRAAPIDNGDLTGAIGAVTGRSAHVELAAIADLELVQDGELLVASLAVGGRGPSEVVFATAGRLPLVLDGIRRLDSRGAVHSVTGGAGRVVLKLSPGAYSVALRGPAAAATEILAVRASGDGEAGEATVQIGDIPYRGTPWTNF